MFRMHNNNNRRIGFILLKKKSIYAFTQDAYNISLSTTNFVLFALPI